MKTIVFIILTMVFLAGCGVESESSVSLSSSVNVNIDSTDSETNETEPDSNETDPGSSLTEFTLFSSVPSEAMQNVAIDSNVTITFNNALDSSTVNESSFSFIVSGNSVLFSVVDYVDNVVVLKSDVDMEFDSECFIAINSGLKDIYGNSVSGTTTVNFTTKVEEVEVVVDPKVDAIYDEYACGSLSYRAISDNSLDPEGFYLEDMGLKITSYYRAGFNAEESEVALFYPKTLEVPKKGVSSFVVETYFSFVFDQAWIDNSNSTIYIKSPIVNEEFECYRYELNTTNVDDIKPVLVYNNL